MFSITPIQLRKEFVRRELGTTEIQAVFIYYLAGITTKSMWGETGRKLAIRIEHEKACRMIAGHSAVEEHSWVNDHNIDFKKCE